MNFNLTQTQTGGLSQIVVNLADPPTLSQKSGLPPLYALPGARYRDRLIYSAVVWDIWLFNSLSLMLIDLCRLIFGFISIPILILPLEVVTTLQYVY